MGLSASQAMMLMRMVDAHALLDRVHTGRIIDACAQGVCPTLMTGVAIMAGSISALVLEPEYSVWHGVALGVAGGIVTSLVGTIVIVPTVYAAVLRLRFLP